MVPGWTWGSRRALTVPPGPTKALTTEEATKRLRRQNQVKSCSRKPSTSLAQDANVWVATPGLSDGRLFPYDEYHPCLLRHNTPCDDSCPMIKYYGFANDQYCQCVDF